MHARIFYSKINRTKSTLEASVEWHIAPSSLLQKKIIATHLDSFLDLYRDYSEKQLGLKPGLSKAAWLTKMIEDELEEIKQGKLYLATISLEDNIAGFIVCAPVKARNEEEKARDKNLKTDVYISLLAIKPFRYFKSQNKIHIGLGQQLIESVESKFTDANMITLDTRLINKPAMSFYEKLGFNSTGKRTLGGSNPDYYTGYEKFIMRQV